MESAESEEGRDKYWMFKKGEIAVKLWRSGELTDEQNVSFPGNCEGSWLEV